ncbi:OB-fold-containig protein [Citromicrobium bathyomarinum]|uniref:OB-fold-containig protein n=1 Tax=Citromicrobium bathyomarinum TaxID=72174 RepID=UPI00315AA5B7
MELLQSHNIPFLAALVLMVMLAVSQLFGLGDVLEGGDADLDIDLDADAVAGDASAGEIGFLGGLLSLLGVGRVPFLIWLALLLFAFSLIGISLQALSVDLLGDVLHPALAAVLAGLFALPVTGAVSRPLGAILPRDRTSAVPLSSLVGRMAQIQIGTARAGSPARARVLDQFGQAHFVMVEPHDPSAELAAEEQVLLVRKEANTFYAERRHNPLLSP